MLASSAAAAAAAAASATRTIASSQSERDSPAQTQLSRSLSGTQSTSHQLQLVPSNPGMTRAEERAARVLDLTSGSDVTAPADRALQALMLGQLEANQNIPLLATPGSLIERPLDLYKQAVNDPKVLAWFEAKGLTLSTLNIQECSISANVTLNGVSTTETFTVWDNSGWWRVAAQVLAARQVLDPGDFGLPYVNDDRKLIPCNVMLDFYGVVPPASDEEASALASRLKLEGWPEITTDEKVELDKECQCAKESIREAKARETLINELVSLVKDQPDDEDLKLSNKYSESAGDSPLAHKSLAIVHHLNNFFAQPQMIALSERERIDFNSLPVRISENKIEVFVDGSEWYDLTALVTRQRPLVAPFNNLLRMVRDTGNALYAPLCFDFKQILSFSGFGAVNTAGEVRNIIRWLQASLPQATPLGDYGAELLANSPSLVRLTAAERAKIKASDFLSDGSSIIDELGADLLPGTSVEFRRNNADELLNKMFAKDQADSWGLQLLQELHWYGTGQTAAPEHYQKLLLAAIKLVVDPDACGKPGIIAGYDVYQAGNLGRDLTVVRTEIEQHLIEHKGVSSLSAPLIAHLFLADAAPEFLAQDLNKGIQVGNAAWMALSLGIAIAEVLAPGCSRIMTPDQLMSLALLEPTTPEQELLFKSLAADISIIWAVMNGVIQRRADCAYSSQDYETAAQKFATQRKDLSEALKGFTLELHTRRELAALELRIAFPKTPKALTEAEAQERPLPAVVQVPIENIILGPRQHEELGTDNKAPTKSIVEAYMDEDTPGDWEMCDVQMPNMDFDSGWTKLPLLKDAFSNSVDVFFNARKQSFITATKSLIATLPLEDRQSLECGEVRFFTLREETGKLKEDETSTDRASFRGRQGTLLRTEYQDGERRNVSYFEVFPGRMLIIKRTDLPEELPLNGNMKIEKARVSRGGPVNVDVQRGTELRFDFDAYAKGFEPIEGAKSKKLIIEELGGSLPASTAQVNIRGSVPNSYFSQRTSDIVDRIINGNLLQGERDFLFEKAKGTTTAEENRAYREKVTNFLLQLIPFVGCTEDLRSGDRMRFINGAFGCFTDLVSSLGTVAGGVGKLSTVLKSITPIRAKAFEVIKLAGQTTVSLVNPLDGVSGLVAGGARTLGGFARLCKSGMFTLAGTGIGSLQTCLDRLRGWFGGFASGAAGAVQPNRMNTFINQVTGTVDGSEITAIRDNGKWYALDKTGSPIGRALDNFIVLTA
ncbi:hypothetical protein ABH909_003514 [Pseudomonas sp. BS3782 TE3695]|uniref:hypothetical protein n=1 Tax=Pseudomonas sp. BS3782 TE3695 TaxID=3349323 RepID=UPI003D238E76